MEQCIAITMGDPAGIGPEIIVKAFKDKEISCLPRAIVIGDAALLRTTAFRIAPNLKTLSIHEVEEARFRKGTLEVVDLQNVPIGLSIGKASSEGGRAAIDYIRKATDLAMEGKVCAITTAPINKKGINLAGFPHPGHTEFLAEYTQTTDFSLMMIGPNLRVVLVTNHIHLRKVSSLINKNLVARVIRLTHRWLSHFVTSSPKIAVTGLNPHCGEEGLFGDEERVSIRPAVLETEADGIGVTGPYPADSLFYEARNGSYDAVIAMYHDQGLTPVKMDSMGHAVNLTMGLPIVRTSVDHGTAYNITGKAIASPASLIEAVKTAAFLFRRHKELETNKAKKILKTT